MMKFTALLIATMSVVASAGDVAIGNWFLPFIGTDIVFTAQVGDTISFSGWDTGHNVYIHPTNSCDLDGAIFVGDTSPASYTFTDADGGKDIFFACDIGGGAHCQNGQSVVVTVGEGVGTNMDMDMTSPEDMDDSGSSAATGPAMIATAAAAAAAALLVAAAVVV